MKKHEPEIEHFVSLQPAQSTSDIPRICNEEFWGKYATFPKQDTRYRKTLEAAL